jgi:hypothetical protein
MKVRLPNGPRNAIGKRDIELKMLLRPIKAKEFESWPTNGFDSRSRTPFRAWGGKGWAR